MARNDIKMVSFSTNYDVFSPITQLQSHLHQSNLHNYKQSKDYQLEFTYQPINSQSVNVTFIEIKRTDKAYSICSNADSYVILLDLESSDVLAKIDALFDYMNETCNIESKVFIIGCYYELSRIPEAFGEVYMTNYLEAKQINFTYFNIQIHSSSEMLTAIDFIFQDTLKGKLLKKTMSEIKHKNIDYNKDNSKSRCVIF